ncbi:MAG: family 16 glycoside hydrolase, partial [Planctomycetota bacterium]
WTSARTLGADERFADSLSRLEELSDPNQRTDIIQARVDRWWRDLDRGGPVGRGWTEVGFDDGDWKTMTLPATWSADGLDTFDGIVHFRRTIELPVRWDGKGGVLSLGPIDDYDDVWVNGTLVGQTHEPNRWQDPRRYPVPAGVLRGGENVVAVRVLDTGGLGGINGEPAQLQITGAGETLSVAGEWRYAVGRAVGALPRRPEGAEVSPNTPTVLFNGMVAPIVPYALRGVIWYQGESNVGDPALYRELFPAMIDDWRRHWGRDDLAFHFVQIAPFKYRRGDAPGLREAQAAALDLPGTGMAVTLDIGNPDDIHPRNKQEVGRRLALCALARTYGREDVIDSGPMYRAIEIEGSTARLRFDHVRTGLRCRDDVRRPMFYVAGADRRFVAAEVEPDGSTLLVRSDQVPAPVAVRYAWSDAPEAVLFNGAGLPAAPFRTDDWDGPLPPADNDMEMEAYRSSEPGFVPLFNGRDLSGWVNVNGAPSTWQVRDGVIECSGVPTGVLRTDRQFENFEMEIEWRHLRPRGNAGIFVWSDPLPVRGQPFTRSIEVQVMDGLQASWYTSDGDIFPIHGATMTPENGRDGGSRAFPTERRVNASPLWNHYRITCRDGAIDLAVNGKVVTRGRACLPRRGYLCLESEGSPVQFRNVRIRELPAGASPAGPEHSARLAEGFVPLYNGVDLSGWRHDSDHEEHWRVKDWRLDFDGQGPDLWTERSYGDFVLICDWRWTGPVEKRQRPVILASGDTELDEEGEPVTVLVDDAGDSGIYLRGSSKSQVNIWCWPIGSGEVYGYRTDPSMPTAVRAAATPSKVADAPIGEWNRFVITMRGDRLTVELNGTTVIDDAALPGVPESGPIALQRHGDPIQFANVYIRELE